MSNTISKDFQDAIRCLQTNDVGVADDICKRLRRRVESGPQLRLLNELERRLEECSDIKINSSNEVFFKNNELFSDFLFLIVTPVYNGERFIKDTLDSVAINARDLKVFYHIQDGGSDDRTLDIVYDFISKNKNINLEISVSSEKDEGMYDAINRGFNKLLEKKSSFSDEKKILSWINSDDVFTNFSFKTVSRLLCAHDSLQWVTGASSLIDEYNSIIALYKEPIAYSKIDLMSGKYNGEKLPFVQQEGTFWRGGVWKGVNGLDSRFKYAGDWDLWRRLARHTTLIKLDVVLAQHRRHESQLSNDKLKYLAETENDYVNFHDVSDVEDQYLCARYDILEKKWNVIDASFLENKKSEVAVCQLEKYSPIHWPKISIITPTFNQGDYIEETITSVLNQNYPNLEFIIIDGGSTDKTLETLNRYDKEIDLIISEPDEGQSDAINKGFTHATGDIFTWLNSDDQLQEKALFSVALEYLESGSDLIIGICEVFENGKIQRRHLTSNENHFPLCDILDLESGWNAGQFVYQPECFFSSKIWRKSGGYVRKDCFYSMDYELWSRFSIANAKASIVGLPLIKFRSHPEQKTADPTKFKAELKVVREEIINNNKLEPFANTRPLPIFGNKLKVAFVNDHGFKYGAGIAHHRMFACIDQAGHNVKSFDLVSFDKKLTELEKAIRDYSPDLIICGNMHSAGVYDLAFLKILDSLSPVFWVTHDLWMLTGRCAYMDGCNAYLYGCNAVCPTADEYPKLARSQIHSAWSNKWNILKNLTQTTVLSNSGWAKDIYEKTFRNFNCNIPVERFTLGAPSDIFKPGNKELVRQSLIIPVEKFVLAISVSSLSDRRKGASYLLEAIRKIKDKENIHLLLIGNPDQEIPDLGVEITKTGYLENQSAIVSAMNCADIYIGPSLEETFGQVFIEAALCGVPSVSFKGSGTESAIIDGVTGCLVERESISGLVNAIEMYFENPEYLKEISFTSEIYAKSHFSLEKMFHSLFNVFRRSGLIDRKSIPHQISYKERSSLSSKEDFSLNFLYGFDQVEGPYSEGFNDLNCVFRWMLGGRGSISLYSEKAREVSLSLSLLNILFENLDVSIYINGLIVVLDERLFRKEKKTLKIKNTKLKAGDNIIEIVTSLSKPASDDEKRDLSLVFLNVDSPIVDF